MTTATPVLKHIRVKLRRKGRNTTGHIDVQVERECDAGRAAIAQCIDVSYPNTRAADWLVLSTEERKPSA
ncbi:hypothetical protein [Variovorax sp. HJSM1_2]|uniref:hypothetical protein n=1 Tax=Variovorax sp. HJSM1_2 TaxID=3366263 RepID=UPI003BCB96E9